VTIVLVTHEPEVAEQARRIVHMRDGKVIDDRQTEQRRRPVPADTDDGDDAGGNGLAPSSAENTSQVDAADAALAPGANATLWAGLFAGICLACSAGCAIYLAARSRALRAAGVTQFSMEDVPRDIVFAGLAMVAGVLLGLIAGALAVWWGSGARRELRTNPSGWRGRWRIALGTLFGWAAILVPAGVLGFELYRRIQR